MQPSILLAEIETVVKDGETLVPVSFSVGDLIKDTLDFLNSQENLNNWVWDEKKFYFVGTLSLEESLKLLEEGMSLLKESIKKRLKIDIVPILLYKGLTGVSLTNGENENLSIFIRHVRNCDSATYSIWVGITTTLY